MRHLLPTTIVALTMGASLLAQYPPPWRNGTPVERAYVLPNGERGVLSISKTGSADRFRSAPRPHRGSGVVSLPFAQTRHAATLWSENEYLVSGWNQNNATAVLVRVRLGDWNTQPVELLSPVSNWQGHDAVALLWNSFDESLYLIDGISGELRAAPMPSGAPVPPAPAFVTIATANDAYPLGRFDPYRFGLYGRGPGHVVIEESAGATFSFALVGGQWTVSIDAPTLQNPPSYGVYESEMVDTGGPLTIVGPIGSFLVEDAVSGITAFSGTVSVSGWNNIPIPAGAVVSGGTYEVSGQGSTRARFLALDRYGSPPDVIGTTLSVPLPMPNHNVVGDQRFGVATAWTPQEGATLPITSTTYLWMNVTNPDDGDPLLPIDLDGDGSPDAVLLVGGIAGSGYAKNLTQDSNVAPIADRLVIPNDPNLVGAKLWFQYVADFGSGTVLLSEVSSVPVREDAAQRIGSAPDPSARRAAAGRWPRELRDPSGQTAMLRIQARLRR